MFDFNNIEPLKDKRKTINIFYCLSIEVYKLADDIITTCAVSRDFLFAHLDCCISIQCQEYFRLF
ncbi:MAG: hypothetical protein HW380_2910 [Magnetococcales bacterium]|nr:hypothetical protein [Magnetococcales bacterium]